MEFYWPVGDPKTAADLLQIFIICKKCTFCDNLWRILATNYRGSEKCYGRMAIVNWLRHSPIELNVIVAMTIDLWPLLEESSIYQSSQFTNIINRHTMIKYICLLVSLLLFSVKNCNRKQKKIEGKSARRLLSKMWQFSLSIIVKIFI